MKHKEIKTYRIEEIVSDELVFVPNRGLARICSFRSKQAIQLKAGTCISDAVVDLTSFHNEEVIKISTAILKKLNIPSDISVKVNYNQGFNQLSLGPILGLYAIRTGSASNPYGEINRLIQEIQLAGQRNGALVYVFGPQNIDYSKLTLTGYYFKFKSKRWVKRKFPIPDVVYDRVLSRRLQRKPRVRRTRNFLIDTCNSNYFNKSYLDKWDVYKHLSPNSTIRRHMPETRLCVDMNDIYYMLNRYRQIYIKPVNGSHGKGICWVTKNRYGYYGHYINWQGDESAWCVGHPQELSKFVGRLIRRKRYIVQQGLNLSYANSKPADIRVLMQKNSEGDWKFTTFIGRVAADGSKVSNFEHGGSLTSVYYILKRNAGKHTSYRTLKTAIINYSIDVCNQLESSMQIKFGELGLDLAMDVYGYLWLIEVNSRPARDISTDVQRIPQSARLSSRRIIDYAGYLAGFTVRPGGE
ncbi:YheC/YheD family protein [Clostridium sp. 'deep sea']|uniref:YheC/YheD family endospore coat-associated protein n=1 Tax=Clostridium sp. 'deep sea' TaxID=2779445 RepID=UPI0018966667|nr:YheC/YheD family protein [Clostridium sp. 'deep sea']QOR36606.1 YheC/YheD family protein [Clostridium sp. 'deep sea']